MGHIQRLLEEGRFPDYNSKKQREILISGTLASRLEVEVGDQLQLFFQNKTTQKIPLRRSVTVVGIYQSGFPEFDENLVFASVDLLNSVTKWNLGQVGSYEVVLQDYKALESVANQIYNALPSDLDVIAITDRYANIFQWIALFDYNILIILIIMIVVGVINIATALLVMILERRQMISLLIRMGSERSLIQSIFLWNGAKILLRGLLWGNFLGLTFFFSQKYGQWIKLDPKNYFVNVAPVHISLFQFIILNFSIIIICLIMLSTTLMIIFKKNDY